MNTAEAVARLQGDGMGRSARTYIMRHNVTGELLRITTVGATTTERVAIARAAMGDEWYCDSATRTRAERFAIPMWGY